MGGHQEATMVQAAWTPPAAGPASSGLGWFTGPPLGAVSALSLAFLGDSW